MYILLHQAERTIREQNAFAFQSLVDAGAVLARTPREAVANADVIVSCLFDDKSCLETAQGDFSSVSIRSVPTSFIFS
jgi:3-hydroxyisobutyrate dehydrogenase-like beta-hydroxyacid dehydrogenase